MSQASASAELAVAVCAGDRAALARAITLVESTLPADRERASLLMSQLLQRRGGGEGYRIGVTGAPGVGKSTFIDTFGSLLCERGHKVAVLSIDPSSPSSGGSILGDKVRMTRLGNQPNAFIRPSPSAGARGGIAAATAESVLLCEAAGYDVVIVESAGVGQLEHAVRHTVDFLLLLVDPAAGDEVQGLKRGLLEVADCIVVNKADGDLLSLAEKTRADYAAVRGALADGEAAAVLCISALQGSNIEAVWQRIAAQHERLQQDGELLQRRGEQTRALFNELLQRELFEAFNLVPAVAQRKQALVERLQGGELTPRQAVSDLVHLLQERFSR